LHLTSRYAASASGSVRRDDLAQDLHARHAGDVRDDVVQLQIHLHQGLLHVLDVRGRVLEQSLAMPHVGAERNDLCPGAKAGTEQPVRVELLDPLRVVDVGLAARHVLRVARVDEHDLEPTRLEDLEQRDPVDTGRLHRDRVDAETDKPVGERDQIRGEARNERTGSASSSAGTATTWNVDPMSTPAARRLSGASGVVFFVPFFLLLAMIASGVGGSEAGARFESLS
jgi:hypothetical protein